MNNQEPKNNSCLISYGIICFKKFEDDTYKIVLVRRKSTIGYVEFLRGKYDINDEDYLIKLFDIMTINEKKDILKYKEFNKLRELLGMTKKNNIYKAEYDRAERKFNILKTGLFKYENKNEKNEKNENNTKKKLELKYNLETLVEKSNTKWNETEWGVPKGRKQQKEMDLNCGIREFVEETNIKLKDIKIIFNLKPLVEEYVSINGIKYKHIYYFANHINKKYDLKINPFNLDQVNEINAVSWLDKKESQNLIREYYIEKKDIINKAFCILDKIQDYVYLNK